MPCIPPRCGCAFTLDAGQTLEISSPQGQQVADLLVFNRGDIGEVLSSGRTIDYASKLFFSTGDTLYSNRSNPMLVIGRDEVGRHDFLLTPCSQDTFRIIYGHDNPHQGCFGNLASALEPYGIAADAIPVAFNVFMYVTVDGDSGRIDVLPPLNKAGQVTHFTAQMDLLVGLTACSAEQSNGGSFKEITYKII